MRKSIWLIASFTVLSTLALGCMPESLQSAAFEPRSYPYVPELGPDSSSSNATGTALSATTAPAPAPTAR